MLKIMTVLGTRPEAIKMAPVIHKLAEHYDQVISRTCVTAQHRQILDQVLDIFGIKPDYDLEVMQQGQTPTQVAALIMAKLEPILLAEKPDWVLVQGDTTTVAAGAWAAFHAHVKVAHVEAGLRTHDKLHPFPEEINRRIVSVISDIHFAPTEKARQNLLREGISDSHIIVTGNSVIDALHWIIQKPFDFKAFCSEYLELDWDAFTKTGKQLILVTAHRRESFGQPLKNICLALQHLAERYADLVHIVYPVHPNPNVSQPVHRILNNISNITLIPPIGYQPMVHLIKNSYFVITDSGGIQEEAPSLGRPVLVLRDTTERPEGVDAGAVCLIGTEYDRIIYEVSQLLENPMIYKNMSKHINIYGDGLASERIVRRLLA